MKFKDFLKEEINVNKLVEKIKKIDKEIEDELQDDESKDYKILIYKKLKNNLTVDEIVFMATMGFDSMIEKRNFINMLKNLKL